MAQTGLRRSQRNIKPAICQPAEHRKRPCIIENLPPEILREIFTHRFDEWLVPLSLFLVNRWWNEVASDLSLLRSVIHIGRPWQYEVMSSEYEVPVFCTSAAQFTKALARLGDGMFELSITYVPEDISLDSFPLGHRCLCLELGFDPSETFLPFVLPPMEALEELRLGQYLLPTSFDMMTAPESSLLEHMEVSAPSLRTLRIYAINGQFPMSLMGKSHLLERLREFELVTDHSFTVDHMDGLLAGLPNVTSLLWEPHAPNIASISTAPKSLKKLSLLYVSAIQLQGLDNLVDLTVGYSMGSDEWEMDPEVILFFPALETLSLVGSWLDLQRLRAPLLRRLSLEYPRENNRDIKAIIPRITLSPKVLIISNHISDSNLKSLLRGVWSGIEELHLLGCKHREVPSEGLMRELTISTKSGVICPRLWCLTFRVRFSEETDPTTFRRSVEKLQSVRDSRKNKRIGGLVRIRCGWDEDGVVEAGADLNGFKTSGIWFDVL